MAKSDVTGGAKYYNINVSESEYSYIKKKRSEKPHGTTSAQFIIEAINERPENDEDSVEKIYESMCSTEAKLKAFCDVHKSVYDDAAEFIDIVNECMREYSVLMTAAVGKDGTYA